MHTCVINNKKYIGITNQTPYTNRFSTNGSGYKTSTKFWNAIQKYGWNNFIHCVLEENLTKEEACNKEVLYIKQYKTTEDEFGYNIMPGGQTTTMPQCVKDKISKSNIGNKNCLGNHHSEETKRKISEAQKGKPFTPEHYRNLCESAKKRRGKPGHAMSEDNKNKLIEASKKSVKCVETGEVFDSMTECAERFGVLISNLSRAIKENRIYKGYHFEKVCL